MRYLLPNGKRLLARVLLAKHGLAVEWTRNSNTARSVSESSIKKFTFIWKEGFPFIRRTFEFILQPVFAFKSP